MKDQTKVASNFQLRCLLPRLPENLMLIWHYVIEHNTSI